MYPPDRSLFRGLLQNNFLPENSRYRVPLLSASEKRAQIKKHPLTTPCARITYLYNWLAQALSYMGKTQFLHCEKGFCCLNNFDTVVWFPSGDAEYAISIEQH